MSEYPVISGSLDVLYSFTGLVKWQIHTDVGVGWKHSGLWTDSVLFFHTTESCPFAYVGTRCGMIDTGAPMI